MKYCRNNGYGVILTQIGIVVYEIQPNKLEVTKSLQRCVGAISFVEVLEVNTILSCFEKFMKSSFVVITTSGITLYISNESQKQNFFKTNSNKWFVLLKCSIN